MKNIIHPLLFAILFSFSEPLISQNSVNMLDRVYGLDQTLCNGKQYNYSAPPGTKGHQYLISPDYISGSVTLKGKCYQNVNLNYDIVNQLLLLQYEDERGNLKIIEVSKAWLTSFRRGKLNFEFLSFENKPHFYQVLGEGPFRILYYWHKNFSVNDVVGSSNYFFTDAIKDSFVLMNGQLKPFRTKRSLIRLFDPEHRPEIKSYLRKNKVRLKKATNEVMAEMITFIGNIR